LQVFSHRQFIGVIVGRVDFHFEKKLAAVGVDRRADLMPGFRALVAAERPPRVLGAAGKLYHLFVR
jgi:hypothetical protein